MKKQKLEEKLGHFSENLEKREYGALIDQENQDKERTTILTAERSTMLPEESK